MTTGIYPFQVLHLNEDNDNNWSIKMKVMIGSKDAQEVIEKATKGFFLENINESILSKNK